MKSYFYFFICEITENKMNQAWQQKIIEACDRDLWHKLDIKLNDIIDNSILKVGLVDNFYLPLFFHLYEQVNNANQTPVIIGINAPQGGGKTTLTNYLVKLFEWSGLKAVTLSIDDFYLTREVQLQLAKENPENIYLQQRGYPGTHDIDLGVKTLECLKITDHNQKVSIPRYDKSRHQGQGDRLEKDAWPYVQLPVDIILFEGWMLGFQPIQQELIPDIHLNKINSLLKDYDRWYQFLDGFLYLYPEDPEVVIDWRTEAEENMKANGLPGMSKAEVRNYTEKFLPAYNLYGQHLIENPPTMDGYLYIKIGKNRLPVN